MADGLKQSKNDHRNNKNGHCQENKIFAVPIFKHFKYFKI